MLVSARKKTVHVETIAKANYPQLVDSKYVGLLHRLKARFDREYLGKGLFLGYCRSHEKYYLDRRHTNDTIRCPICDNEFLLKHGYYSKTQR